MGLVYRRARRVVVWLGEEHEFPQFGRCIDAYKAGRGRNNHIQYEPVSDYTEAQDSSIAVSAPAW